MVEQLAEQVPLPTVLFLRLLSAWLASHVLLRNVPMPTLPDKMGNKWIRSQTSLSWSTALPQPSEALVSECVPLIPCSNSVLPMSFMMSHSPLCKIFLKQPIIVVATISELDPVLRSVSHKFRTTMCSFSPRASCDATMLSATSSREQRTWQQQNTRKFIIRLHQR